MLSSLCPADPRVSENVSGKSCRVELTLPEPCSRGVHAEVFCLRREGRHLDAVPLHHRLGLGLSRQAVREEDMVPQVCRSAAVQLAALQDLPERHAQR